MAIFALYILAAPVRCAQDSPSPTQIPLQATTELVKVETSVMDRSGNFVADLSENNFRVLDNGIEQPIAFFAPVEAPAQVLVMIETSPAVYLIQNEHLAAAYSLLKGLAPDDQVALVTYDQSARAVLGFTADKNALLAALDRVQYTIGMGDLNFYDSVSAALDWITPTTSKKALVLLTTGLDSSSPARWDALVQKLRGQDAIIFSVALGGSLRRGPDRKSKVKKGSPKPESQDHEESSRLDTAQEFARADSVLRSLATLTGGRAYFPESEKDFVPIYREIASTLRHQYVLGIAPIRDGQLHALTVQVVQSSGQPGGSPLKTTDYSIFTRAGYLAPRP
jgi:VWFA-related protein